MLPVFGNYCLVMALCLAVIQAIVPMLGTWRQNSSWIATAKTAAMGQFLFIGLSFTILAYALVTNDFSVAYVAQNSNTHLPLLYKFCATWGAHEGSLLLWVLILSIWTILVGFCSKAIPKEVTAQVLSVLAMISIGFLLFLLLTSNPFSRLLNTPLEGRDLNPLLQDPGLAIHPPMLYMGYVGFSVAFAFAITALINGRFDATWAKWARPWTLIAWSFLTLGITLGSWWAYRVLGWGGWWFWDPVENASFLPWLAGTALIHSLLVAGKRDTFKAWTILLAVCTFSLSLMGTFLVRSGILVSVHAFAVDPARGAFMLYFLTAVVGGSLLLYAWRGQTIKNSGVFQLWSRETLLLTNNVLLVSAMLTVLLGTLYPLIIDGLGLGKLSVGPPYFNLVFVPLMLPVLLLMGIAPALQWQNSQLKLVVSRFKYTLFISGILALLVPWILTGQVQLGVVIGLSLAFWVIIATLQQNISQHPVRLTRNYLQRLGMAVAHCGFAICVVGIVVTSVYSLQKDVRMQLHDHLSVGPYQVTLEGVAVTAGPNYKAYRGSLAVIRGKTLKILTPELRLFETQKMALAKTAIEARPFGDLYIALAEQLDNNAWSIRIYYKPFIRWIWAGGILMMLGGILAALPRSRLSKQPPLTASEQAPSSSGHASDSLPTSSPGHASDSLPTSSPGHASYLPLPSSCGLTAGSTNSSYGDAESFPQTSSRGLTAGSMNSVYQNAKSIFKRAKTHYRLILPLLLFLVMIFFFWIGLGKDPNLLPSMLVNKPVPKLVMTTLDGQRYSLAPTTFKSKVTLLNVWATWCAACQIEQSLLMDLAKNQEIQLLGLDYKDNRATAKQYLQKNGNPYQQVLFDGEGKYAMELGIYGTPETFLIDKHGIVRYRYVGPITLDVLEKDLLPRISAIQGEK